MSLLDQQSQKLLLWGGGGQMGEQIKALLTTPPFDQHFVLCGEVNRQTPDHQATHLLHTAQVIIDFSHADATARLARLWADTDTQNPVSCENLRGVLIGTTALSEATTAALDYRAHQYDIPMVYAANTSIGIFTLYHTVKSVMNMIGDQGFDVELMESHHNRKYDSPSGTAHLLLSAVTDHPHHNVSYGSHESGSPRKPGHVGVHAVRGGGIYGDHKIQFISQHESLTLSHRALSRTLFAQGALTIATKLTQLEGGPHKLHDLAADFLTL